MKVMKIVSCIFHVNAHLLRLLKLIIYACALESSTSYDDDYLVSNSPFLNMTWNGKTYVLQTSYSSSSEEETGAIVPNAKRQRIQSPVKTLTNRGLVRKQVNRVKSFPYKRTSKTMLRPSFSSSGSTSRILTPSRHTLVCNLQFQAQGKIKNKQHQN